MLALPNRRTFLQSAMAVVPLAALPQYAGDQSAASAVCVKNGIDRFDEHLKLGGANLFTCKVSGRDNGGALFIFEQTNLRKGGPPRHLHHSQDEWFYVMEGQFIAEVGNESFKLAPGDSLFAPRGIPHAFAHVGENTGRLLIGFQPAGQMERFFHETAKLGDYPADAAMFRSCGMELVGGPLPVD
jgi:quercetin dioxygenase-like cupin family protein